MFCPSNQRTQRKYEKKQFRTITEKSSIPTISNPIYKNVCCYARRSLQPQKGICRSGPVAIIRLQPFVSPQSYTLNRAYGTGGRGSGRGRYRVGEDDTRSMQVWKLAECSRSRTARALQNIPAWQVIRQHISMQNEKSSLPCQQRVQKEQQGQAHSQEGSTQQPQALRLTICHRCY